MPGVIRKFAFYFFAFITALFVFVGIVIVYAWTEPASAPPTGNVSAPVNVGATSQYKSGALGVGGVFHGYSTGIFDGNVGIGTPTPETKLNVVGSNTTPTIGIIRGLNRAAGGTGVRGDANGGDADDGTKSMGVYGLGSIGVYGLGNTGGVWGNNGLYAANPADAGYGVRGQSDYGYGGYFTSAGGYALITGTGNVGIGTLTPSQRLDVSGYVRGATGLCIGDDCRTSWPSGGGVSFPIIVQPSSFTSLNEDQTHNQINQGWITHQILMTKHIGTKLKFKLHLVGDYDQHLKVRLCYGATVTNENVPEFALTTANCGTEIKNIGGAWTSTNRSPVSREGEANLTVPDNQYKYITLQTSIDGGNYYWGWLHYLIEE